ncbi:hypothetical protein AJ80_09373 [Polytolypa hystricis UAMH7299]|uniref:N-acetyltransferase domain-containing protein n=1 Tax=Polytolypa hystricis (strain UAMH7299) TaxID=1447883 RepID=A0A2B7WSC3_POLH7|nr:hypothetical protein AJ80_09373 [Polytolypa hystricis UAMH7299]
MGTDMNSPGVQLNKAAIRVEPINAAEDFVRFFDVTALAFGRQIKDGIWIAMNPGWDTPEGRDSGISRLVDRWSGTTKDRNGNPNTIFLKATVPRQDKSGEEDIAGVAIWVQASMIEGYGDAPTTDLGKVMDLNALYPESLAEQKYLRQLDFSLHQRRIEVVNEIASSSSSAAMVLDLCVVDPAFQRLGIATKLVEWGLLEAKRLGGLEAILEASSMGRHLYEKLGFEQDGGEFQYHVDEEFQNRDRPSNIFMRTGRPAP